MSESANLSNSKNDSLQVTRPGSLAEAIRRLRADNKPTHFLEFLDEFYDNLRPSVRNDEVLSSMLTEEPDHVNSISDAFFAATAEHLIRRWNIQKIAARIDINRRRTFSWGSGQHARVTEAVL